MDRSGVPSSSDSSRSVRRIWAPVAVALIALCVPLGVYAYSEGDVVISEMMIAPKVTADEWFELYATTDGLELQDCVILNGPEDVLPDDPLNAGKEWDIHVIDASLTADEGDYLLLSRSDDCVGYDETGGSCVLESDFTYTGCSLSNSDDEYLMVACQEGSGTWTLLDSAPVDWQDTGYNLDEICGVDNYCSATLGPAFLDHGQNDELESWITGSPDDTYYSSEGVLHQGTPGEEVVIDTDDLPGEGDVVFVEVVVDPGRPNSAEWFEVQNVGSSAVDLQSCRIRRTKLADDSFKELIIVGSMPIAPGEILLFASECIEGYAGDDDSAADPGGDCSLGEIVYGSDLSFPNDEDLSLTLRCPPTTTGNWNDVDSFAFNDEEQGIRKGHSMMFVPGDHTDPATANNSWDNWCEAAYSQCFINVDDVDCEYGTPGEANECLTDWVDWPDNGPACRCRLSSGRTEPLLGSLIVTCLGLLVWARRRA